MDYNFIDDYFWTYIDELLPKEKKVFIHSNEIKKALEKKSFSWRHKDYYSYNYY